MALILRIWACPDLGMFLLDRIPCLTQTGVNSHEGVTQIGLQDLRQMESFGP